MISKESIRMNLNELTEVSRYYGNKSGYVLAGGGNTSCKNEDTLYIKASGFSLAEASADSFVGMDRKALALIWEKEYSVPGDDDPFESRRESEVLSDMMAARKAGQEQKRPSVETLLHDIIPFAFVVHLHPALVNGLTCSQQGEEAVREIFGEEVIWIPSANPGYNLAGLVREAMNAYYKKHGKTAQVIFLQNHGVFVGAKSTNDIKEQYGEIMSKISAMIKREPDFSDEKRIAGLTHEIMQTLSELAGSAAFMQSAEISALVKDRASFVPVSSAFTPDHIVYSGSDPLFTEAGTAEGIRRDWETHVQKTGRNPKIIAVRGLGVFSAAATEKAARLALDLFRDAITVSVYAESFGGCRFMPADQIDFINNWEVERYRSVVSIKEGS